MNQPDAEGGSAAAGQANVADLDAIVAALPRAERELFGRLFHVTTTTGSLIPPESMHAWLRGLFGSVEATQHQKIVKVTNLVTFEGSLFNELRSRRPMETKVSANLREEIEKNLGDPFCRPEAGTPEDVFGRVRGHHSITASNIAKYDGFHGVVIFDEHNPLQFTREKVFDYIDTSIAWGRRAHEVDPEAKYLFVMWNCLWKSGASILHGHTQVTLGRGTHYAKVEFLRRAALAYRERHGASYFDDLYRVHEAIGCGFQHQGVRAMGYLAPIKEKEIVLLGERLDETLKDAIFLSLNAFERRMGVTSFNLVVYLPPIASVPEDWSGFPVMVRLVDRGDPMNRTADMGAMELYASSVIASDPFAVTRVLRESIVRGT